MSAMSERISLIILGVSSLLLSRGLFLFFDDPEGTNLLVTLGTASIVYFLSLTAYRFNQLKNKRILLAIFIQIIIVFILYFALR
jgi:hypothetical protein